MSSYDFKFYNEGNCVYNVIGQLISVCEDTYEAKDKAFQLNGKSKYDADDSGYSSDSFGYNYADWN